MAQPTELTLTQHLGIGRRELVSFVGAGGKTTLLLSLGDELAASGSRLVLTTTTKMGADQTPTGATMCRTFGEVRAVLDADHPALLVGPEADGKLTGVAPTLIDDVFTDLDVDHVLVEADGARKRSLKAPAPHEPVVPTASTTVVVVAGLDSVGHRIADVAHRPDLVAALLGGTADDVLRPQDVAMVIGHPDGGLARIPISARVVVALTKATDGPADEIVQQLNSHPRIDRVVVVAGGRPTPDGP